MAITKHSFAGGKIKALFTMQTGVASHKNSEFTDPQLKQAATVGQALADFISAAKSSLHMAIYDFRLQGDAADLVVTALNERAKAGVDVRIAYFEAKNQPTPDAFALLGSDPAVVDDKLGGAEFSDDVAVRGVGENKAIGKLASPVVGEAIHAPHNLMHSKYIIRDGMTQGAAVLMGSANFTTDAWSVQDNNILIFEEAQELSAYYENDFGELWQSGKISNSGKFDTADVQVGGVDVSVLFAPGQGRKIGGEIAALIDAAEERLLVASMVISSAPILGAIIDRMHRVQTFAGLFDGPEMQMIIKEWDKSQSHTGTSAIGKRRGVASSTKADEFKEIAQFLHRKDSLPFKAAGVHNFMHNKFAVIDDTVVTGSFNFSTNAQNNAENVVIVKSKELADAYADYMTSLTGQYKAMGLKQAATEES